MGEHRPRRGQHRQDDPQDVQGPGEPGRQRLPPGRVHLPLDGPPRRAAGGAAGRAVGRAAGRSEALRPALWRVVEAMADTPALVMNDRNDVLAWNRMAAALIADFPRLPPRERNMARRLFLDPDAREVHLDWAEAARTTVGILRMAAGRRPHDPELVRLLGELSLGSQEFRTLWAGRHVHEKSHGRKRFHHPAVGEVALDYETFRAPGTAHHLLVVYTAAPGSRAEEALGLLGALTAEPVARH